jgi:hypothetical protein
LIRVTLPLSGANRSLRVFTLSMVPKALPASTVSPGLHVEVHERDVAELLDGVGGDADLLHARRLRLRPLVVLRVFAVDPRRRCSPWSSS